MERLLNIRELSKLIGLPVSTIYSKQGGTRDLPRVRLGRHVMFRLEDVQAWIKRHTETPAQLRLKVVPPVKAFKRR
jgi:excisionase family DNA binding protein